MSIVSIFPRKDVGSLYKGFDGLPTSEGEMPSPCFDCPFTANAPERFNKRTRRDIAMRQDVFVCHHSHSTKRTLVCAGAVAAKENLAVRYGK